MVTTLLVWLAACDGGSKDDSSGGTNPGTDDSATDDSGTSKKDDTGGTDDTGTGCSKIEWFQDLDHDGYGAGTATLACKAPETDWVEASGDCNDSLAEVNPAATEICNKIDDDCDTAIDDEDDGVVGATWYPDADGDGYGDFTGASIQSCAGAGGYAPDDVKHPADCDDADDTVYPGAPELCDDVPQGCVAKDWKGDVGVATFYPAGGGAPEDWTADLMAGKKGATAKVSLLDEGELVICDGTWYAQLVVGDGATFVGPSDITITGLHGSGATILSGGGDSAILRIAAHSVNVTAQGLTMTEGDSCFGAAISTGSLSMCSSSGASISWAIGYTLTLRDVRVVDNLPTLSSAFAAAYIVNGTLMLEDSTIANNSVEGIEGNGTSVYCSGDPKSDAGVWGNSSAGLTLYSYGTSPLPFESDGCDFDGTKPVYTPSYDVYLSGKFGSDSFDFGDDAVFACDITSAACAK